MDSKLKHSPDVWARMHLTPVGQTAKEILLAMIASGDTYRNFPVKAAMQFAETLHAADQKQLDERAEAFAKEVAEKAPELLQKT